MYLLPIQPRRPAQDKREWPEEGGASIPAHATRRPHGPLMARIEQIESDELTSSASQGLDMESRAMTCGLRRGWRSDDRHMSITSPVSSSPTPHFGRDWCRVSEIWKLCDWRKTIARNDAGLISRAVRGARVEDSSRDSAFPLLSAPRCARGARAHRNGGPSSQRMRATKRTEGVDPLVLISQPSCAECGATLGCASRGGSSV